MQLIKRIPRLLRWITSMLLLFVLAMTLLRLVFFFRYNPPGKPFSGSAMLMGLRFDVKFACIMAVSILLLCSVRFLNPFKRYAAKSVWNSIIPVVFFITLLFYAVDYYHYDYIRQRLNASFLNYFNDAAITINMGLQSYPVVAISLLMIAITVIFTFIARWLLLKYQTQQVIDKRKGAGWYILFFLLFALGIFGKIGQFNLRWSDAFTLSDNFKANLALNPFQSFFSSLKFRDTKPDIKKVKQYYPLIADYLGVQKTDSASLNYERDYSFAQNTNQPNVVLVICESFCMFRSSMSGNPLNTTPYFNELCKQGIFYDRCFTPSFPTARGVWATVTGIPDVLGDNNRTASRSPEVVNQQTIINDLKGYQKFYFLGGDPTWANIKGVLLNNIDSLQLYSQENFKAKKVDVWGIDDKNLLLESNQVLAKQQRPFFAVIQTADNHRPYTIPEEDLKVFKKMDYPKDSVLKYGFEDIDQLNAFRYTDYCFQQFMEAAKKEKYFSNTIFVFVGDHGLPGNANAMYPKAWSDLSLTRVHVPLLFYAPQLLQPKKVHNICSQLDIMPSIATLLKTPYRNNSMGQSLFDGRVKHPQSVFTIDHELRTIGMATNGFYYLKNMKTGKVDFVSVLNNDPVLANAVTDSIKNQLGILTDAYYETSKYLLFNNKRK
ncbi:MAG: sulfatase-like hydrolase/transferase [Chitinophagaceae bacterium]|nr:sulfatase-like hydrolase/transferase [Chitinophagaceae bacterium]